MRRYVKCRAQHLEFTDGFQNLCRTLLLWFEPGMLSETGQSGADKEDKGNQDTHR
jgi:hypothetical protein